MFYGFCLAAGLAGGALHFLSDQQFHWPGSALIWVSGLILLGYGLIRDIYLLRTCPCDEAAKDFLHGDAEIDFVILLK